MTCSIRQASRSADAGSNAGLGEQIREKAVLLIGLLGNSSRPKSVR